MNIYIFCTPWCAPNTGRETIHPPTLLLTRLVCYKIWVCTFTPWFSGLRPISSWLNTTCLKPQSHWDTLSFLRVLIKFFLCWFYWCGVFCMERGCRCHVCWDQRRCQQTLFCLLNWSHTWAWWHVVSLLNTAREKSPGLPCWFLSQSIQPTEQKQQKTSFQRR